MGFLVSPGIDINEVDQTNVVPATSTSVGAYAGHFNWGPVDEIVNVSSEKELLQYFGSPKQGNNTRSFLTAASFLKYSNALRVSRALGANSTNAANSHQMQIKNKEHFDTLSSLDFIFSARFPGALGNSLSVSYAYVAGSADSDYDNWAYKNLFDSAPNKSLTAAENGISTNDEIHVVVIDRLGMFTGSAGSILEKYEGLSLGANAKNEDGASIFYKDVINENSSYVFVNTLTDTFTEADSDITEKSVFAVEASSISQESSLTLPFNLEVETTVTYSGGNSVTTSETEQKAIVVKSGFSGAPGNNAKINIRKIDVASAPAMFSYGFISFGAPVNGDKITVNGTTFTKAAAASATEFATINDLVALIDDLAVFSEVYASASRNIILEGGDAVELSVGVNNTGTMTVSGPTTSTNQTANSLSYLDVTIDALQLSQGYITYDVTVATDEIASAVVTDVTLADIINRIKYESAKIDDSDFAELSFFIDDIEIDETNPLASMKLDIQSVSQLGGGNLSILSFTGGEAVTYNDNTLINTYNFVLGADGTVTQGGVSTALGLFIDKDAVDINLLFAEVFNTNQSTVDSKLYEVANTRRDIVAFVSEPMQLTTLTSNSQKFNALINKFDDPAYGSSSFVVFTQTPVYTYNKYADKYVWIPSCGHAAGLCANADFVADPWFSPAGFNRGQLKGVTKIAYNPSQTERDELYKKRINSIVTIPGEGVILYGDKTALTKPSAFDRINVRRLFNVLERSISQAAKYQLFELNDEFTRASFKNTIEPFLRDVQGRRGIIEFKVVCDETNNTEEVIDSNEFVGDIYIKPAKSINFIHLNFIATRSGVEFKEIVGN